VVFGVLGGEDFTLSFGGGKKDGRGFWRGGRRGGKKRGEWGVKSKRGLLLF